jgi:uncharacterized protein (DUF1330 family)
MSKHYTHVECTPTSFDWIPEYLDAVPKLVDKHGGRYIYKTTDFDSIEMPADMPTTFVVLIEWPDANAAAAFYDDPEYQSHKQARLAASDTRWFNAPEFAE